jgi:hypothetical protein
MCVWGPDSESCAIYSSVKPAEDTCFAPFAMRVWSGRTDIFALPMISGHTGLLQ